MESEIFKYFSVGGTPATLVLGGYLLYRWISYKFNSFSSDLIEIKKALNCKVSAELYKAEQKDTERRIDRLEKLANGKLS